LIGGKKGRNVSRLQFYRVFLDKIARLKNIFIYIRALYIMLGTQAELAVTPAFINLPFGVGFKYGCI